MSWYREAIAMEMGLAPERIPLAQRLKKETNHEENVPLPDPPIVQRVEGAATD